jgi:dTDP-4-amino-4,6-dideoxygalactose transaminase
MTSLPSRIYLSPPHMSGRELSLVTDVFDSNWIAPLGPHVDAFEAEFRERVGARGALALSSGTAGLHLALLHLGVGPGDTVFVSDLTFAASVNPIHYLGAEPVLIDAERESWNMDPALLEQALEDAARAGRLPRAVVVVHLYGQAADLDPILAACARFEVPLVEDAAEALGATYRGRAPGSLGRCGVFSFNGNKIITTSGGGMLVSDDEALLGHARKLCTQAREPAPHYEHAEIGFNYRLSNVLAAIGRGQLAVLDDRVRARRANFDAYQQALGGLPGVEFQPEAPWGTHSRWLTCMTLDADAFGAGPEAVRLELEARDIEARPLWKPMHLQPVFRHHPFVGSGVGADLFHRGLCLPSGSSLTPQEHARVVEGVLAAAPARAGR